MSTRLSASQRADALMTLAIAVRTGFPAEAVHVTDERVTILANEISAARWRAQYPNGLPIGHGIVVPLDVIAVRPLAVSA